MQKGFIQVIRSARDCNLLLKKHHTILKVCIDRENPKYLVFLFKNSKRLQDDLAEITKIK